MTSKPGPSCDTMLLGHRAAWLRHALRRHSAAMAPRDRDVLTLIALQVDAVSRAWLMNTASVPGISGPPAVRRAEQLVTHPGLLVLTKDRFDISPEWTHG